MNDDNDLGFQKKHFDAVEKRTTKPTNRIEEIRERHRKITQGNWFSIYDDHKDKIVLGPHDNDVAEIPNSAQGVDDAEFMENAPNDIQYLLSKLEIAEKALELAVKELDAHDRNEHMEYGDFCSEYKPCTELVTINEALQQIRS